jgi:hypothetical protein
MAHVDDISYSHYTKIIILIIIICRYGFLWFVITNGCVRILDFSWQKQQNKIIKQTINLLSENV